MRRSACPHGGAQEPPALPGEVWRGIDGDGDHIAIVKPEEEGGVGRFRIWTPTDDEGTGEWEPAYSLHEHILSHAFEAEHKRANAAEEARVIAEESRAGLARSYDVNETALWGRAERAEAIAAAERALRKAWERRSDADVMKARDALRALGVDP